MTYALCSNAITLTSNQKFSERLAGCKQKTKRGAKRPPERIVMESDIKKMTDDWLVEVMLGTIKYPLELRKQCEREFDRRERSRRNGK